MLNIPGDRLTVQSIALISCDDLNCLDTMKITRIEDERSLTCSEHSCRSQINPLEYGSNQVFQLEVAFSDGATRKSNVFTKEYFYAKYQVAIQADALLVEELQGRNSTFSCLVTIFMLSPLALPLGCGLVVLA